MARQSTSTNKTSAILSASVNMNKIKMTSFLLDKVSAEIRLEILRYLVGQYTTKELDMKSAQVRGKYMCIII